MVELSKSGFAGLGAQPVIGTKEAADKQSTMKFRRKKRQARRSLAQLGEGGTRSRVHGITAPEVNNRYSAAFL